MRTGIRIGILVAVLAAVVAAAPGAEGAQCWFLVSTGVAFGTYDPSAQQPLDSSGLVVFLCNPGARNVTVSLSPGQYGTFTQRQMAAGGERLGYNLYRDAARTLTWGDGTAGTSVYGPVDPPNWLPVTLSIFGRVPSGQDVAAGLYHDTVVVTINF